MAAGGSGDFLMAALHRAGFSNITTSQHPNDGLKLTDAFIAAAVRCAPPDNKPSPEEIARCLPHLDAEIAALPARAGGRRARKDRVRRIPSAAQDARRSRPAAPAVRSRIGRHPEQRSDLDRVLSPKPAEYEHRQADGFDDGRCVSQVASRADEEPSPIAGVQLRCESTTIVLRCHLRHRPRHHPRCTSRHIDFRARRVAGAEDPSCVGARTHRASRRHQSPITSISSSARIVVEPVTSHRSNGDRRADRASDGHCA